MAAVVDTLKSLMLSALKPCKGRVKLAERLDHDHLRVAREHGARKICTVGGRAMASDAGSKFIFLLTWGITGDQAYVLLKDFEHFQLHSSKPFKPEDGFVKQRRDKTFQACYTYVATAAYALAILDPKGRLGDCPQYPARLMDGIRAHAHTEDQNTAAGYHDKGAFANSIAEASFPSTT